MALITCPECGGKVSDQAAQCIHCGYPLNAAAPVASPVSTLPVTSTFAPQANTVVITNPLDGATISNNVFLTRALLASEGWMQPIAGTYNVMITGYSGCTKYKAQTALHNVCGYTTSEAGYLLDVLPTTVLAGMSLRQGIAAAQSLDSLGVDCTVYGNEGVITFRSYRNNGSWIWNLALGALLANIDPVHRCKPRRRAYVPPKPAPRPRAVKPAPPKPRAAAPKATPRPSAPKTSRAPKPAGKPGPGGRVR